MDEQHQIQKKNSQPQALQALNQIIITKAPIANGNDDKVGNNSETVGAIFTDKAQRKL